MSQQAGSVRQAIADALSALLSRSTWIQVHPYSQEWNAELTWLLDNGYRPSRKSHYIAEIGGYSVWIANHPYGSFSIDGVRPRRATILRAWEAMTREPEGKSFASDKHLRADVAAVPAVEK